MAANREQSIFQAIRAIWKRGKFFGFYQGLIPWVNDDHPQLLLRRVLTSDDSKAWIEGSTKGAVLLFAASEIDYYSRLNGCSPFVAGLLGGIGGGLAQAYTTVSTYI